MRPQMETENNTFDKILSGKNFFEVPKFQRDYAWSTDQWEDLWQDIVSTDTGDQHYMGYLVLQAKDGKSSIIDGQQRITTITLFVLAALQHIKNLVDQNVDKEKNQKRLDTLKEQFIGSTNPVTLEIEPKLILNRNNRNYFSSYLCEFDPSPPRRNTKPSEKLLSRAKDFFFKKIAEANFSKGEEYASLIKEVTEKLLFTSITVGSDLNAYRVFETLNARGVQLSVPDLTKNYLFSLIDAEGNFNDQNLNVLEGRWDNITNQLGKHDFSRFIHAEWNSRNSIASKNSLFKVIKSKVSSSVESFEYLKILEKSSEIFAASYDHEDSFWNHDEYKKVKPFLETLNLFNIVQPRGVLLASYNSFDASDFVKVLRMIEVITVRWNIIGSQQANRQERVYNKVSQDISKGLVTRVADVRNQLREIYIEDEEFFSNFKNYNVKTSQSDKKARYLLSKIEEEVSRNSPCDYSSYTLEHVLPRSLSAAWTENWNSDDHDKYVDSIGNMTLLEKRLNQESGNSSFLIKKEKYAESACHITRTISSKNTWTSQDILNHAELLAHKAKVKWRIDFSNS